MADIWTAVVSAASALSGVGLTLLATRKNENRRWEREREARETQWLREDRHRFIENKRALYAKLLDELRDWFWDLSRGISDANAYAEQHGEAGPDPDDLMDRSYLEHSGECRALVAEMTMLAPGEMANLGRGCVGLLSDYHLLVIKNWGNRDFTHQVKNVTTWIEKFVAEGRTDLGVATDKDVPMSWMTSNH